jgi:RNA polymerase sigma factor (sigma-70 family)
MKNFSSLKDEALIKNILNKQCNESLKELVNRHSGMLFNIGKKYCASCNLNLNELNDNKYWIIFNAAQSFNSQKGSKFSTWLGNQVRFFCLNFKNKNSKLVNTEDSILEFFLNDSSKKENCSNKNEIINNIIDLFNQITDMNTKNAIYYRYFYDKDRILNYSEIAEILQVTPQTVLNWHNKFIKFAKKKLTNKKKSINI